MVNKGEQIEGSPLTQTAAVKGQGPRLTPQEGAFNSNKNSCRGQKFLSLSCLKQCLTM